MSQMYQAYRNNQKYGEPREWSEMMQLRQCTYSFAWRCTTEKPSRKKRRVKI